MVHGISMFGPERSKAAPPTAEKRWSYLPPAAFGQEGELEGSRDKRATWYHPTALLGVTPLSPQTMLLGSCFLCLKGFHGQGRVSTQAGRWAPELTACLSSCQGNWGQGEERKTLQNCG